MFENLKGNEKKQLQSWKELGSVLFENSLEGLFIADKNGQFMELNLPFCNLLGYTKNQALTYSIQDIFPYNDLTLKEIQVEFDQSQKCVVRGKENRELILMLKICRLSDDSILGIISDENIQREKINPLNQYKLCVKNAPLSIYRIKKDSRIIEANDEACKSLGYTQAELTEMTVFDIDPMIPREVWKPYRENLKSQGSRTIETNHRRKDGSTFPVEVTVNYFEFQGEEYSYSFAQDISQRKFAETQANQSRQRFRLLSEASFEGIAFIKQGLLIDANDQFASMFGYEREEILNSHAINFIAPEDREMVTKYVLANRLDPYVYHALRKNGTKFTAEVRSRTTLIDNQEIRVAVIRDITEQKRIENDLQKVTIREKEAFRITQMGHWEFDMASAVFTFNDQFYEVYGTTAEAEGGYKMSAADYTRKFMHPEDVDLVQNAIQESIQAKSSDQHIEVECRIIRADGAIRNIIVWVWLEKNDQGETIKTYGVNQDITDRKLAEEEIQRLNTELEMRVRERTAQLVAANKELESFAYSVSHDLRAPLRAINGFSLALNEDYKSVLDDTGQNYLNRILSACTRMSLLIDSFLKLSQVTRSGMLVKEVNLSNLVREITNDLQASQPDRKVVWNICPNLFARVDEALIRIVLTNLLGNAWKFSAKKEEAYIEFGARMDKKKKAFYVQDNGAGFNSAHGKKLFREFQRLHSTQDFEGTGIGLALVQRIIHRHGGEVWAEGMVDHGATFYFTFEIE